MPTRVIAIVITAAAVVKLIRASSITTIFLGIGAQPISVIPADYR
ncbi:hypothetical protein [Ralstonia pickettii]|nr:hypothetical protein [Ralstonia pickettii]